ncbi:AAWKG family protein [Streptomyces sp. JH34]|uniref:AAWKG family protein n=1 Tax=Streptomyces sp. JH34 TaxID=2793633 RepID=UPI0023F669F9|nr:AAWKG family protein [Streptomyces sp. JH34]MDF6018269.1 AAWKG family protein [Streptomyces sp. JH34]
MADRYDPNSVTNIDKYDDTGAASADTWATLVTHITGYPVPDRATVFDKLRSDHGGKLFRMDIKERSLSLLVKDSGFLQNKGEDYDIWFFDSGKKRSIMQARIVFEGRVKAGEEVIFAGTDSDDVHNVQVREGNEFTDYNKDKMSTIPLAQYMNGPRAALLELLKGGTQDARFSNLGVAEEAVVDLNSFNRTGDSFDFAAKFFKDQAPLLKDWEDRFGRDDASWKGEAAEVFRSLLKKVRENYDSYVETFNSSPGTGDETGTGNTVYSRALSLGRSYLVDAANTLLSAWLTWAKSPYYDPHRVLRYVLDDLAQWVDAENVAKTDIKSYTSRYTTTVSHSPQAGFSQVHPDYGDLSDIANWAKVGDKAVEIWNRGVDDLLVTPARQVQSALNNHFLDLGKDFADNVPKPKSTSTASEEYEEKKLEEEKEEIKKENAENKQYQDELREEQRKQREEDKKYQDELREEQRLQREEDKKLQDELRNEQNQQREEDKKYQDELREEQKREQEEAKKLQEDLRNEQNQQRDEDKKYQDELREEQKREQEEAKREAEEQQKIVEESLGGLNDPNAPNTQNLDDLFNVPVTESNGDLGNINNPSGADDLNNTITEELGNLGDVNNPGGENQSPAGVVPPVSQNLGSLGNLNNGPGGTKNATDAANEAIAQNLGNLGDLNGGAGGSLDTPTGGSTQLGDNGLTTDFPDGSSTQFDPDSGVLTTTHPDGSVTTQNLGDGARVTNPDGSVTSLGDDGKLTTTFPDGTKQVVDPATGQAVSTAPDGTVTTENLGNLGGLNSGNGGLGDLGDINSSLPTDSIGDLGNLGDLNGGAGGSLETPTGGSVELGDNGLTTDFPDGSSTQFDPDTGQLTTTHPDGSVTTQDLGELGQVTNSDGSVTSLGDDGKLTTTFPDGTKQVVDPATGQAVSTAPDGTVTTENLGNLGNLNGGAGGSLETPTGGSVELGNNGLTTDFPDGSSTQFDPDTGQLTTTHPDGSVTTQDLGELGQVTNSDGSVTSLGDDGKLTTTFPDGTKQVVDPATGQAVSTAPDGTVTTENLGNLGNLNSGNGGLGDLGGLGNLDGLETPTGGQTGLVDGDFATMFADGGSTRFDPESGMLTSTGPDGSTVETDLTHGARVNNPDGSTTFLDDGQLTTTFPDGSKQIINPDTGVATVTDAQGRTETVDLKDLNSSIPTNSSGILDELGGLGDLDGLGGSGGGGGGGTTSRDVPFSELGLSGGQMTAGAAGGGIPGASLDGIGTGQVAPLSDSATAGVGTPLAAAGGAGGAPGAPGTPGSPGMPMGGGMGGMGAGGEKGNGERVRSVLVDAAEESERRTRRRRSPWNRQEDSDTFLSPASRVTTTGGDSPEEPAEPGRRPTTSADYLEEDADVWGTEEGGTPSVIGR